jgi:transcriptional regulator with XRE-family HTH domain
MNKSAHRDKKTLNDPRWQRYVELHRKFLYVSIPSLDFRTTELARALRVTRRTIQRWMKGIGAPKEDHLREIDSFIRARSRLT